MLLIKKWFTEIVLVYFLVGYTYKKVDGIVFAKIGKLKKTQRCETLAKFKSFVAKAFKCTPWNPEVDKNMLVWDWKIWLAPLLCLLKRFNDFYTFCFTLNQKGDCCEVSTLTCRRF
jgi:hypothetical protein